MRRKMLPGRSSSDGIILRRVHKIDIIREISIVANPAYIGTEVNVRSIESNFEQPDDNYKKDLKELRNLIKM